MRTLFAAVLAAVLSGGGAGPALAAGVVEPEPVVVTLPADLFVQDLAVPGDIGDGQISGCPSLEPSPVVDIEFVYANPDGQSDGDTLHFELLADSQGQAILPITTLASWLTSVPRVAGGTIIVNAYCVSTGVVGAASIASSVLAISLPPGLSLESLEVTADPGTATIRSCRVPLRVSAAYELPVSGGQTETVPIFFTPAVEVDAARTAQVPLAVLASWVQANEVSPEGRIVIQAACSSPPTTAASAIVSQAESPPDPVPTEPPVIVPEQSGPVAPQDGAPGGPDSDPPIASRALAASGPGVSPVLPAGSAAVLLLGGMVALWTGGVFGHRRLRRAARRQR